jgi:uncharacterized protein (DUF885 family)
MAGAKSELAALAAEMWDALVEREPFAAMSAGRPVARFPRGDLAEAQAVADAARTRRARLDHMDVSRLDRTERLTAACLRHTLDDEIDGPALWWTSFGIAPYSGSGIAILASRLFPSLDPADPEQAERYLALAAQCADAVEAMGERVEMQAERGWRLPQPALAGARCSLEGTASIVTSAVMPGDDRGIDAATRSAVTAVVEGQLNPAFDRLLAAIGADYEAAAPEAAGMMHQPGGTEAYRLWMRHHLGFDADPAEIHAIGLEEVSRLAAEMRRVRIERFGHDDDEESFHEKLRHDLKAKVPSAEALEASYRGHLDRMAAVFPQFFRQRPRANGLLARLPREQEAAMTFGYYVPPREAGGDGTYFYSGNGIPDRLQLNRAALIFHELVPGHHVQIARQQENEGLPDIRRQLYSATAFVEGWAEYAASLAEEAGLYDDPYDLYGFLSHQRFVAQRLVVDTGLNALGWSLDEAHAYMSANTLEQPEQVTSEILRYATDMPAQALCYRMGFLKFRAVRDAARMALGPAFDLADFHEAILAQGTLPLPVLEANIADWARERAASGLEQIGGAP